MDKELFNDYVKNRYNDQMAFYDKNSVKNKTRYKTLQWTVIVLSSLSTAMAATGNIKQLQFLIVISTLLVAILTTGLKTFNYQELWVNYRNTTEQLKPELYYYEFRVGPYAEKGINREALFVARVESILDKEHASWPASKNMQDDQEGEGEGQNP
jgi:hypothetical protein